MFTRAAFGAIVGTVLGLLLDPLLKALPLGAVVKEFIDSFVSDLLTLAFTVAGALLSKRIRRLDRFIADHLWWIASSTSFLFAISLWLNAGLPTTRAAVVSAIFAAAATAYLLIVSGWTIRKAMQGYAPDQQREALDHREAEAKAIVQEAVFSGEPDAAAAIFSLDAAGRVGEAFANGCLFVMQVALLVILTLPAATLVARHLYGLPWLWALLTGAVVLVAGMGLLEVAGRIGTAHADRVPLAEKYEPILPPRDT